MQRKIVLLLILLSLSSCSFFLKDNQVNEGKEKNNDEQHINSLDLKKLNKYITNEEIDNILIFSKQGNYEKSNLIIDKALLEISKRKKIDQNNYDKVNLTLLKVSNLLNEGNYLYKEKEKSKKSIELISELIKNDPDYLDPVYANYYLGYSNEIIKNYDEAEKFYNLALSKAPKIDKNKSIISIILNQKGHLQDLKGNTNEAYKFYNESYSLDNKNYLSAINLARYFVRIGAYKKGIEYFNYGLQTKNKMLKSEIYFSLSSLELEIGNNNPDIEKSIKYAKKSIVENKNNSMGYFAIARGYYMLNDNKYNYLIEKNLLESIKNYENNYSIYRLYGLYMARKGENLLSNIFYEKAKEMVYKDMILMDDQRKIIENKLLFEIKIINLIHKSTDKQFLEVFSKYAENNYFKTFVLDNLKIKNYGLLIKYKDNDSFNHILKKYNFISL